MHLTIKQYPKKSVYRFLVLLLVISILAVHAQANTILRNNVNFQGSLNINSAISKGSGTFVIDHPLDPENKLLYHSFVESPDAKNMYDGIAILDAQGEAIISLPDYFEVLNKNAVFLLTPLLVASPGIYVKNKGITNNQFTIGGGTPNAKVSWQVTGTRQDPYIVANPIINEVEKGPDELVDKGEYLFKDVQKNQYGVKKI